MSFACVIRLSLSLAFSLSSFTTFVNFKLRLIILCLFRFSRPVIPFNKWDYRESETVCIVQIKSSMTSHIHTNNWIVCGRKRKYKNKSRREEKREHHNQIQISKTQTKRIEITTITRRKVQFTNASTLTYASTEKKKENENKNIKRIRYSTLHTYTCIHAIICLLKVCLSVSYHYFVSFVSISLVTESSRSCVFDIWLAAFSFSPSSMY